MGHLSTRFASDTMCGHWQYRNVNGAHVSLEICGSLGEVKGDGINFSRKPERIPGGRHSGRQALGSSRRSSAGPLKQERTGFKPVLVLPESGTLVLFALVLQEHSDEAEWERHHVTEEINS